MFALLVAATAFGQVIDNDYYSPQRDNNLLRLVENAHLGVAEQKIRAKYYNYARGDIEFILRFYPNHPRGLQLMVHVCSEPDQRCDLQWVFEKAIATNPKVAGTYVAEGIYLHGIKRYGEAIKAYQHAIALDASSMNAHYNLGLAYLDTKQYDLANLEAGHAYALGAQLPGLRDRLKRLGKWKPDGTAPTDPDATLPAAPGSEHDAASSALKTN